MRGQISLLLKKTEHEEKGTTLMNAKWCIHISFGLWWLGRRLGFKAQKWLVSFIMQKKNGDLSKMSLHLIRKTAEE
jgi:hypothetical protein